VMNGAIWGFVCVFSVFWGVGHVGRSFLQFRYILLSTV
jgi:hypothetical protein